MKLINPSFISATLLSVLFFGIVFTSCKKDSSGPNTESYIITIDSILHADTIDFGTELTIKFYGIIGTDGCYSFDKFEPEYTEGVLSITTWGIHTLDVPCTENIPYLNGSILLVNQIPAGTMIINAVQADGTMISQSVFVKE